MGEQSKAESAGVASSKWSVYTIHRCRWMISRHRNAFEFRNTYKQARNLTPVIARTRAHVEQTLTHVRTAVHIKKKSSTSTHDACSRGISAGFVRGGYHIHVFFYFLSPLSANWNFFSFFSWFCFLRFDVSQATNQRSSAPAGKF